MCAKTVEEKLKFIEEQEAILKTKKKLIMKKASRDQRKERTKRLIVIGATVEAKMKELTGKEEYPITEEKLPEILNIIKLGYKIFIKHQSLTANKQNHEIVSQ